MSYAWQITPKRRGLVPYFMELWAYRQLLGFLGRKILEKQYHRTFLGKLWLLIRPAMVVAMYTILFGVILGVDSGQEPFLVFVVLGFTVWNTFDRGLTWGTRSMDAVRSLLTKIYFPRMLLPIAGQGTALIDLVIFIFYLLLIGLFYWLVEGDPVLSIDLDLPYAVLALAIAFYLSVSFSLWTSILDAKGRDMRFSLRYILQVWMFSTPVVYPSERIPEAWRWIIHLNPMTPLVEVFRDSLLIGHEVDWQLLVFPLAFATAVMAVGLYFFLGHEARTIDSL